MSVWVDQQPPPAEGRGLFCEYVQTWARTLPITTGTFNLVVKDRSAFPPKRCAFSPPELPEGNSCVLETF